MSILNSKKDYKFTMYFKFMRWRPFKIFLIIFALITNKVFAEDGVLNSEQINKIIQQRVDNHYNSGIVVGVIDAKGERFFSYGKVSNDANAPLVNQKTVFPIASITKVFTTLLLAIDVKNGLLQLDAPAQKYLPDLKLPTYGNTQITLKDLATHTSGLPGIGTSDNPEKYKKLTKQEFYQLISHSILNSPPGIHYEYSNIIGLLADITAHVSHSTYEKILDQKIFLPLRLNHTKIVSFPEQSNTEIIGYDAADIPGFPERLPFLEGAWAMYSNAEDLARFISANLGFIKTDLHPAMQLTHKPIHSENYPTRDIDFPGIEKLKIGLGWNIDDKHNVIWKNGNIARYSSFIGFNPKTKIGVVVLANTGNVSYTDNLALHILNPKLGLLPVYREIKVKKEILNQYTGTYHMSDGTYYQIVSNVNCLKAKHIANGDISESFNLYPMSNTSFFVRIADAVFTFIVHKNCSVSFTLKEGGTKKTGIKMVSMSGHRDTTVSTSLCYSKALKALRCLLL